MAITQRQIAESVAGLKLVARDLIEAADGDAVEGTKGRIVMTTVKGLRSHADFLDRVATELLELVDDNDVEIET